MSSQIENKPAEQVKPAQEQNVTPQPNNTQQPVVETAESLQEKNWKTFRENREVERKQAEENARQAKKSQEEAAALKAALDAVLNKPQTQQTQQQQYNQSYDAPEETESQRIEKLVNAAIEQRQAVYDRERAERERQEYPRRLESEFKDFNNVCTTENLDYLDYHYPEIAKAFAHMPEGYDKWASVYKAVKRFIPNADSKKESARAEKNLSKPQSMSSPGATQGNDATPAFRLDEKRKAENWARMQRTINKLDSK